MTRILIIVACFVGILHGKAQELTVCVNGQPLESLLTKEEVQSLYRLNITGKLTDADYAFLRNEPMNNLKVLNLRDADIDTIPAKAFVGWNKGEEVIDLHSKYHQFKLLLPKTIIHIGDSAFYAHQSLIELNITGNMPECGKHVFYVGYSKSHQRGSIRWTIAEENRRYKINNGIISSIDGRVVFQTNEEINEIYFDEGVSTIAAHAFEDCLLNQVVLPESIDSIGDYAFHNLGVMNYVMKTKTIYSGEYLFVCKAQIPPSLGTDALNIDHEPGMNFFTLYVPTESVDLYKSTEGWNGFWKIESIEKLKEWNPHHISLYNAASVLHKISSFSSTLLCTAPDAVKLEVYTMDAIKVGEARFVDGEATVKVGQAPAMYLYIVTYPDGRRESGKAMISEE